MIRVQKLHSILIPCTIQSLNIESYVLVEEVVEWKM